MKLILNTEQERIIFSSLLHTQVECRMIGDDADAIAKYPTLVCMAELTHGVIGDVLDKMLDEEGDEDETI
tara:strand:- start:712 stop:921 length:210 start_codon:yes stop_codon:yes gene_type:complete